MNSEQALIIDVKQPVLQAGLEVLAQLRLGERPKKLSTMNDDVPVSDTRRTGAEVSLNRRCFLTGRITVQVLCEASYDFGTVHRIGLSRRLQAPVALTPRPVTTACAREGSQKRAPTGFPRRGLFPPHTTSHSDEVSFSGTPRQSIMGAMMCAKLFRARFSRLFTVPRLQPVISAISSYVFPSISRRTKTMR